MSWLSNNSTVVAAIGSIFMDIATLVIIFFNMNQLRLNRRSLNIDINFKVFEQRKKIFRNITDFINDVKETGDFSQFIEKKQNSYQVNENFRYFKELLEDSKYLFSLKLFNDIERFLFLCEHGINTEIKILNLKEEDPSLWTNDTTDKIQVLTNEKKDILTCIYDFELEQFLKYLNVCNFHLDFISEPQVENRKNYVSFLKKYILEIRNKIRKKSLRTSNS